MKKKPAESVGSSMIWSISPGVTTVLEIRSLGSVLLAVSHQYSSTTSVGDVRRNGYPYMQGTCTDTELWLTGKLTQIYLPNVCISILKRMMFLLRDNSHSQTGRSPQPYLCNHLGHRKTPPVSGNMHIDYKVIPHHSSAHQTLANKDSKYSYVPAIMKLLLYYTW